MLDKICQIARNAGHVAMSFYNFKEQDISVSYKLDKTPITNVDREISNIIKKKISLVTPDLPIISEEENHDFKISHNWNSYWLIDPLDGTKEFLNKNGEFTINISLVDQGIPVLGVIYAPFFDVLYSSFEKKSWKETNIGVKKEINVLQSKDPLLLISRSHSDPKLKSYLKKIGNYKVKKMGSSLKFCLIAEGVAQIYPRFGKTCIWDTSAGHAILSSAGGFIRTWKGNNLNYSLFSRTSFINEGFCASSSLL